MNVFGVIRKEVILKFIFTPKENGAQCVPFTQTNSKQFRDSAIIYLYSLNDTQFHGNIKIVFLIASTEMFEILHRSPSAKINLLLGIFVVENSFNE